MKKSFKELRKQKGFTQEGLAKEVGVKQCTVSSWENGNSKPDLLTTCKVAQALDCAIQTVVDCFF